MSSYKLQGDGFWHIRKDPGASLVYTQDWSDWMAKCGVSSIIDAQVTLESPLTADSLPGISGGLVGQQIGGGSAGDSLKATYRVTFNDNTVDERTIVLDIIER